MSLSLLERRELLAMSDRLDACRADPDAIATWTGILRTWVAGKVRSVHDDAPEQLALLSEEPVAVESTVESAPEEAEENSPQPRATEVRGLSLVESAPSSSSDLDPPNREKKTARVRPCTDDALPDDFRSAYAEVVAERGVRLPSAEYLWSKYVEHLWEHDITFASRWNLKRKWRSWCWYEKPAADESTPPPPASETRPVARAVDAVDPEERSRRTERALREQRAREDLEHAKALPDIRTGCAKALAALGVRAPPEPRSCSA